MDPGARPSPGGHPWRILSALGFAVTALPLWAYFPFETAAAPRVVVGGLALLAACLPASALLAAAALLPLAGVMAAQFGTSVTRGLAEPMVLACLAGWSLRFGLAGIQPSNDVRSVIRPALVFGLVVIASVAARSGWLDAAIADPWVFAKGLWRFLGTTYYNPPARFDAARVAMVSLEGFGLFVGAAVLTARDKALVTRVLAMAACGAAGVAAINIQRLLTVSLRTGQFWESLRHFVATVRFTAAFPDVNAAGSFLAMGLVITLGLAFEAWGERRRADRAVGWSLAAIGTAAALFLTGSRAAMIATVPALLVLLLASRLPKRLTVAAAVVVLVGALAAVPFLMTRFVPASAAINYRVETTRAALSMVSDHPIFGVGLGGFYDASERYFSPEFRKTVPRENAHNYFLQVLAELGIVGFVPFVWMLGVVARRAAERLRAGTLPMATAGAAAGSLAFCVTWLSGHPLLVYEPATAFWVVFGATAGALASPPAAEVT